MFAPISPARFAALFVLGASSTFGPLEAQSIPDFDVIDHPVHSGHFDGPGAGEQLVFETVLRSPGAAWLQVRFADAKLGEHSSLVLTSARNGGVQFLDATSFEQWHGTSAYLSGDSVVLQLFAGGTDTGVFVDVLGMRAGAPAPAGSGADSLCGTDDKVTSTDNRVGRLYMGGCTAWRATNGAFLTAGHCVDFDPDDGGPMLPDGVLDLFGSVEFNVPTSFANGAVDTADPNDQYPIDLTSVVWRFDGENQGLGKDWAVFGVNPNSNTGLLPHEAYGPGIRSTDLAPTLFSLMRITGFGVDVTPPGTTGGGNADNMTNQTSTGANFGESFDGPDIWFSYQVDTTGANSGSPVIDEADGVAVGVHTNAGCTATGGTNSGTSFEVNALAGALHGFPGGAVTYLDAGHPHAALGTGHVLRPFDGFVEAVNATANGGLLSIVAGSYGIASPVLLSSPMTMEAPQGSAVIGY